MIYKLKSTTRLNREINDLLGENFTLTKKLKNSGSCLYNFRQIEYFDTNNRTEINENSRCNFEIFENGLLLRINDQQHYFALPLTESNCIEIIITEGKEKVFPINLTAFLIGIGFKKDFLRKHWLLNGGFYNERYTLSIKTENEILLLDSQGKNYKTAFMFFKQSRLKIKKQHTTNAHTAYRN